MLCWHFLTHACVHIMCIYILVRCNTIRIHPGIYNSVKFITTGCCFCSLSDAYIFIHPPVGSFWEGKNMAYTSNPHYAGNILVIIPATGFLKRKKKKSFHSYPTDVYLLLQLLQLYCYYTVRVLGTLWTRSLYKSHSAIEILSKSCHTLRVLWFYKCYTRLFPTVAVKEHTKEKICVD